MSMDGCEIPCPECGKKHRVSDRQIQTDRKIAFTCSGCQARVTVDNAVPDGLAKVEKSIKGALGKLKLKL